MIVAIDGTPKKFKLTKDALDIVMLSSSDARHIAALKRAAMTPKLFRKLWEDHGADVVSDEDLNHVLVTSHDFRPDAAADAVKQYRKNIEFAKLGNDDKIVEDAAGEQQEDEEVETDASKNRPIEVGDFIQWESRGVAQFADPKAVSKISPDGLWVFVVGSSTGLPIAEIRRVSEAKAGPKMTQAAERIEAINDPTKANRNYGPSVSPIKEYVLTTDTGDVTVQWPSELSEEDYDTVEGWLEGLKRRSSDQ